MSAVKDAIVLQDDEYAPSRTCRFFFRRLQYVFLCFQVFAYWRDPEVKLKDISTGTRWVHRGRSLLFLEPFLHWSFWSETMSPFF